MGYVILGLITFVLIIYFIYDTTRSKFKNDENELSDDEIRSLYEGDLDEDEYPKDINKIEARLSTEFAEEVLNSELEFLKDEMNENEVDQDDEEEELKR
ncbi:hypothetical protein [Haloplasma contractile]|uniref:Uncharacterized protein n=1 Tax=Haloplasma contractile SSD-17B TaxID=1033810 RepID=U2FRB0_9MOLU|nr:hypothetical protein [Haloplasma contractile]ERJ13504.1 hypothetical protein HLPCO_000155 [Haloplasma contractile SSD-17B]